MDTDARSYVIVGRGRWAKIISDVLTTLNRPIRVLEESRRRIGENADDFKLRLAHDMRASGAATAWVCVPPCPDLPLIIEGAIVAGLHVIAEKPWLYSRATTQALAGLARLRRVLVAVNFQYCFLDGIEALRDRADTLKSPRFFGTFTLSRRDRLGVSALDNLGSHLLAIREYAVPRAEIAAIHCTYGGADERVVRIEAETGMTESIQLMTHEPIIQRFVTKFETAAGSLEFPLDLRFASRVLDAVNTVRAVAAPKSAEERNCGS